MRRRRSEGVVQTRRPTQGAIPHILYVSSGMATAHDGVPFYARPQRDVVQVLQALLPCTAMRFKITLQAYKCAFGPWLRSIISLTYFRCALSGGLNLAWLGPRGQPSERWLFTELRFWRWAIISV